MVLTRKARNRLGFLEEFAMILANKPRYDPSSSHIREIHESRKLPIWCGELRVNPNKKGNPWGRPRGRGAKLVVVLDDDADDDLEAKQRELQNKEEKRRRRKKRENIKKGKAKVTVGRRRLFYDPTGFPPIVCALAAAEVEVGKKGVKGVATTKVEMGMEALAAMKVEMGMEALTTTKVEMGKMGMEVVHPSTFYEAQVKDMFVEEDDGYTEVQSV